MSFLYINEHLDCHNYDKKEKPEIEVAKIVKGEKGVLELPANEIVFFIEGRIRFTFDNFPDHEGVKGQGIFLPAGGRYAYEATGNSMVIIFRLKGPVQLCENFKIERLNGIGDSQGDHLPRTRKWFSILHITPRLWHFLDGINDCISDGISCRCYFELKIRELLLLLRAYYSKEELHDFFFLVLSGDTAFSEYVRLRWKRFNSVKELAASMNLTHKQFYSRFVAVFNRTPQEWMMEGKADIIRNEITSTGKQFKQIAFENGFASDTQFTRFCKRTLGKTPTEIREGI